MGLLTLGCKPDPLYITRWLIYAATAESSSELGAHIVQEGGLVHGYALSDEVVEVQLIVWTR